MTVNVMAFVAAALCEIAGCFAFWHWLRRDGSAVIALGGVASLIAFALILTRVDVGFAGRAYAAYGGIYIAVALGWLWAIEGQRPTGADVAGAALAIAGALVIIGAAARRV